MKRFDRKSSVPVAVRRIAIGEIDNALGAIGDAEFSRGEAIHAVRQSIKRLRALLRLVRGHLDEYADENANLRDTGRLISGQRDADVMRQTYDEIVEAAGLAPDAALRDRLAAARTPPQDSQSLSVVAENLIALRTRIGSWSLGGGGFELIGDGLGKVYKAMRKAEHLARAKPTAAHFHEWRKQVKYHTAHLTLLRKAAPDILKAYGKVGKKLGDALGEHHDLDVLLAALLADPEGQGEHARAVAAAIRDRDEALQHQAFRLGEELDAERPAEFRDRIHRSWKAWRD